MTSQNKTRMNPDELTAFLHEQLPLARAMALRVLDSEPSVAKITAPLAPNKNPHHTVFGGSLATLGIICGWLALYQALQARKIKVLPVIQHSECDFLRPADAAVTATAEIDEQIFLKFIDTLQRKSRAQITIVSTVYCQDQQVVIHRGKYVAKSAAAPSARQA